MLSAIFTDEFIASVGTIYSERLLSALNERLLAIRTFPLMGSENLRPSLLARYGSDIRRFPISPFVIVYRYKKEEELVEFLALPYDKTIQ